MHDEIIWIINNRNLNFEFFLQRITRETYLPLDTMKTKQINDQLRQVGGTAKLVVDIIKYDPAEIKVC